MTVKDLIEKLKEFPEDAPVFAYDEVYGLRELRVDYEKWDLYATEKWVIMGVDIASEEIA